MSGFNVDFKPGKRRAETSVFTRCLGGETEDNLLGGGAESWRHRPQGELPSACSSSASFASTVALIEKRQKQYLGSRAKMDAGARREMNLLMSTTLEVADITKEKKPQPMEVELPPAESPKMTFTAFLPQLLAALAVSIASMVVGFSSAYTSPALVSMNEPNSTLQVTPQQESWIGSLLPLFALLGGVLGGPMIETLGRRNTIMFTGIPFLTSFLLIAFANSVTMVMVGRAVDGFCVGIVSLALPIYLGETLQPEVRGSLGLLPTVLGNGGILVCFTAGKFFDWSQLALLGSFLPIVFLALMFFIPETPRWYINKNKVKKAKTALTWLRGKDTDVSNELTELQNNTENAEESSSITEIFSRHYLWPLVISIGLMFFQQLSGINAVIFYTVRIFKDAGSTIDSNISAIIVGLVNCGSTFVATLLIDRLGRKILLNISSISMIITLATLGTFFYLKDAGQDLTDYGWLPLVSFVIFVIGFSIGFGPIPWLMMGEILPARVRGCAASLATGFNWSCTFIVTKTFSDLTELLGSHGTFWLFGGFCVIGLIFVNVLVPETRGKSLEDIEKYFSASSKDVDRTPSRESSELDFKNVTLNI